MIASPKSTLLNGRQLFDNPSAADRTPANRQPIVHLKGGPHVWIGWGAIAAVAGVLLLVPAGFVGDLAIVGGLLLMAWGYRLTMHPHWRAVALVRRARLGIADDQAMALLRQALELDPSCQPALFDTAQRLMRRGHYGPAADNFRRYLRLAPGHTYARARLLEAEARSSLAA